MLLPRALCCTLIAVAGLPTSAATLLPSAMTVTVPTNSNNPGAAGVGQTPVSSRVFTDDVYLDTLTFGSKVFDAKTANFSPALALEVLSGRNQVNVEWGDDDDGADGDDTPMSRIGQPNSAKESDDPAIQDPGMLQVFNTLSLTEMTDGEGPRHSFKVTFQNAITDNDTGVDSQPEIIIFERGRNDSFDLSLIIGGTFENPLLSSPLSITSSSFANIGMRVDTTETGAQDLGVGGFDLNDWGVAPGTEVFGFVYDGFGADLSGIIASGDSGQFSDPLAPVPLPPALAVLGLGLGALAGLRRRA